MQEISLFCQQHRKTGWCKNRGSIVVSQSLYNSVMIYRVKEWRSDVGLQLQPCLIQADVTYYFFPADKWSFNSLLIPNCDRPLSLDIPLLQCVEYVSV